MGALIAEGVELPAVEYERRLRERETLAAGLRVRHVWLGYLRLGLAGLVVVALWFSLFQKVGPVWLAAVPAVLFILVAVIHARVLRRHGVAVRAAEVYRLGLARVEDRWAGLRERAVGADVAGSLYAGDLDIVGRGGLFELLCLARTRMGEERLLGWLLEPAGVSEVRARQESVAELRERVDLRERVAVAGDVGMVAVKVEAVRLWAEAPDELRQGWLPWVGGLLTLAVVAAAVWWALGGVWGSGPLLLLLLLQAAVRRPWERRMNAVLEGMDEALKNMQTLAAVLRVLEGERFEGARLRGIGERLRSRTVTGGPGVGICTASTAIARLGRLGQYRDSMDNMILKALNLPLMYSVQLAFAVQRWRRRHGSAVAEWMEAVAEMEALLSLAGYSYEHPGDVFPEIVEGAARFEAEELGHPLIAEARCVRNSVAMGVEARGLLISGSNMSGKSTLMRTVGVATVMAMCGAPVRAKRLRLTPLRVGASLVVNDSLQSGQSRFYAEIERLRRICLMADGEREKGSGFLFLLDELLQGTNSKDRMVGARGVVRALLAAGAIGIVTTHDLALAEMEMPAGGELRNMHFQDEIVGGEMRFDFKLREGVAMRSNGVELMRLIGLRV